MPQTLQDKVAELEQTLLAINCLGNICEAAVSSHTDIAVSDVAFLVNYLSDKSLFQVEDVRTTLTPPTTEEPK
jgi:hypothetical protein